MLLQIRLRTLCVECVVSSGVCVFVCVSESAAPGWLSTGEAVAGLSEVLRGDNAQCPRLWLHWQLNYVAKHTVTGTYLDCWHTHTLISVTVAVACHNSSGKHGKIWKESSDTNVWSPLAQWSSHVYGAKHFRCVNFVFLFLFYLNFLLPICLDMIFTHHCL